jgi:hypothetical protein
MIVEVQCYSGRKADERPIRFRIGDCDHMIVEIVERWYGPDDSFYKVRTDNGKTYLLRHHTTDGTWSIESVQKLR